MINVQELCEQKFNDIATCVSDEASSIAPIVKDPVLFPLMKNDHLKLLSYM